MADYGKSGIDKFLDRMKRKYLASALSVSLLLPSVGILSKAENTLESYQPVAQQAEITDQKNLYEMLYRAEPYRHVIELTVSKEYTHPSAWAHIIPEENRSCILPHELIDYRLGFSKVLGHEIGHKLMQIYGLPDDNEDLHTKQAYQNLLDRRVEVRSQYTI